MCAWRTKPQDALRSTPTPALASLRDHPPKSSSLSPVASTFPDPTLRVALGEEAGVGGSAILSSSA